MMIKWVLRFMQRRYEKGYVAGWDAAERTVVPIAYEDGRIAGAQVSTGPPDPPPLATPGTIEKGIGPPPFCRD